MKSKLTNGVIFALAILGGLFIVLTVYYMIKGYDQPTTQVRDDIEIKQDYKEKSVFEYSKSEYIDLATRNCSQTESESYCRCFYTLFLQNNSVYEAIRQDAAAQDPNYVFSDEQISMAAECRTR